MPTTRAALRSAPHGGTGRGGRLRSWLTQKSNVARIFELFIAQDNELRCNLRGSNTWDVLDEEVLCAHPIYERLAHFLVHVYKIPKGVKNAGFPLACDSVKNYLDTAINLAASKFKAGGSVATKEFLFCLDTKSSSDSATWLHKLKKKVQRVTFERAKVAGEQQDNSESKLRTLPALPHPHPHPGLRRGHWRRGARRTSRRRASRRRQEAGAPAADRSRPRRRRGAESGRTQTDRRGEIVQ